MGAGFADFSKTDFTFIISYTLERSNEQAAVYFVFKSELCWTSK